MAKVSTNGLIKALSGAVGGLVFRQMPDGSVLVSTAPNFSGRKFSKGQKKHQSRFQEAAAYARYAAKTQPIYAELAQGTMKTAYNIALSDWFNPPVVHKIERKDGWIRVNASDSVGVTKVRVTILDEAEKVLESGEAAQNQEAREWWEYQPEAAGVHVLAEAWDRAGNVSRLVE